MILPILHYPNPLLKTQSVEVVDFDDRLSILLDDMYETMIHKDGVGLAAIQVGVAQRLLIINLPREDKKQYKEDLFEMINPIIKHQEGEIFFTEGCLSIPSFYEDVLRSEKVEVEYQDRFGKKHQLQAQGYLAVAIQHEIDHLDGILFIDRLSIIKRKKFEKELKRIQKERQRK